MMSECCATCRLGKALDRKGYEMPCVWCKKHRDSFTPDSRCDSYQADRMFRGATE